MSLPEGTKINIKERPSQAFDEAGIWTGSLPVEVVSEIAAAAKRSLHAKIEQNAVAGKSTSSDEVFSHLIVSCISLTAQVVRERFVS